MDKAIHGGAIMRLTQLEVSDDPDAPLAAEIGSTGRSGILQGVHVDFRHPQLPADWWARPWWYVAADSDHHCGLIFPAEAQYAKDNPGIEFPPDIIEAMPGDRLTIGRIEEKDEASRLHHRHDTGVRLAFLTLTRVDGTSVENIGPLAFYGSTRLIDHGSREAFDNMVARISDGGPIGFDGPPPGWGADRSAAHDIARYNAAIAHDALFEMMNHLDADTTRKANLRRLVNAAALMGFALAKHEAQGAAKWDTSINRTQAKATAGRRDPNREKHAREIWEEKPWLTTNAVVSEMFRRFPEFYREKDPSSLHKSISKFKPLR